MTFNVFQLLETSPVLSLRQLNLFHSASCTENAVFLLLVNLIWLTTIANRASETFCSFRPVIGSIFWMTLMQTAPSPAQGLLYARHGAQSTSAGGRGSVACWDATRHVATTSIRHRWRHIDVTWPMTGRRSTQGSVMTSISCPPRSLHQHSAASNDVSASSMTSAAPPFVKAL